MTDNEKRIRSLIAIWSVVAWWTWCSSMWMPASGGNRRFSNPSCCGRYRWCVSWNSANAWQYRNRKWRQQHCFSALWNLWRTASIWYIDGTPGTMYPRERRRSGFWFSLRKWSDLPHFRFSRPHQNLLNKWREDNPFTFANYTMEGAPYDLMANVFRDLEDRRWPFKMMRNMWSRTWLTKLIMYHKFDCRYNFFYRAFEKVSQNRKHCISNLFNTASYSTSLLKPEICLRWVSREKSVKPVKR